MCVVRDFFSLSKQSGRLLCEIRQDVTLLFLWHKSVKENNTGQLHYYTAAGHDVLLSRINYLTPCCTISKSECFTLQEDRQGAETMYSIWSEYYKRGTVVVHGYMTAGVTDTFFSLWATLSPVWEWRQISVTHQ